MSLISQIFGNNTGAVRQAEFKPTAKVDTAEYKAVTKSSIPVYKQPALVDTVATKYSDGTPFWADYTTPNKVFIA